MRSQLNNLPDNLSDNLPGMKTALRSLCYILMTASAIGLLCAFLAPLVPGGRPEVGGSAGVGSAGGAPIGGLGKGKVVLRFPYRQAGLTERQAAAHLRPGALGKFGDLLLATAKSPAMLYYLDNFSSSGAATGKPGGALVRATADNAAVMAGAGSMPGQPAGMENPVIKARKVQQGRGSGGRHGGRRGHCLADEGGRPVYAFPGGGHYYRFAGISKALGVISRME